MSEPAEVQVLPALPRPGSSPAEQVRELLLPSQAAIVGTLARLAAGGDPRAIDTAMKYLAPQQRPEAEKVVVPGLIEAATLPDKAAAVLAAVACGQISAEAGSRVLQTLDAFGQIALLQGQEERLRALEGRGKGKAARPKATPPADHSDLA